MKILFLTIGCLVGMLALSASGETLTFPKENFSISFPTGWTQPQEPPRGISGSTGRTVVFLQDAAEDRLIMVMVHERKTHTSAEIDAFLDNVAKPARANGWPVSLPIEKTFGGLPFSFITTGLKNAPPSMFTATTFTPNQIFSIGAAKKSADPSADSELLAILESFRFLKPVTSVRPLAR